MKSIKSMLWTNENLSLMVASSPSVSISCLKLQSSIGNLVWFFDSQNLIVSEGNSWCPYNQYNLIIEEEEKREVLWGPYREGTHFSFDDWYCPNIWNDLGQASCHIAVTITIDLSPAAVETQTQTYHSRSPYSTFYVDITKDKINPEVCCFCL